MTFFIRHQRIINWPGVVKALGLLLMITGVLMAFCIPVALIFHETDIALAIAKSSAISFFCGLLMGIPGKMKKINLRIKEAYLIVSLSWIIISVFGTLPYLLSNTIPNFNLAFFETISGYTTTGASIINDIEALPKGILFWRSMTHWIGGIGIIVLFTAIMPLLGSSSMQLFSVETSSITIEKIHPHIKGTALRLSFVYVIITLLEIIFLRLGGMNIFDAVCHSFGTVATGGFSTQNTSIAEYSPYIQYVIMTFMLLAGINFTLHYYFIKGKFKKTFSNNELWFYFKTVGLSIVTLVVILMVKNPLLSLEHTFRDVSFQVISVITCTGFITTDYEVWPQIGWFIIFLLMFSGGMAGSTAGGIKSFRHLLLLRISRSEMQRRIHPNAIIPVRYNKTNVNSDTILNVQAFFIFYIITFVIGTLLMVLAGLDLKSAAGGTASCLGGIGPGLGVVGAINNYANVYVFGMYVLSFIMLLGRLEIFTLLMIFTKSFWKQ